MYAHANLRDRILLLALAQSGLSEIDFSALQVEDIKELVHYARIRTLFYRETQRKNGQIQATCLSYEFPRFKKQFFKEKGNPKKANFTSQTKDTKANR